MADIVIVNSTQSNAKTTSSTTHSVNLGSVPSGYSSGDRFVLFAYAMSATTGSNGTFTTPSGYTQVQLMNGVPQTGSGMAIYIKTAGASETAPSVGYTTGSAIDGWIGAYLVAIRNVTQQQYSASFNYNNMGSSGSFTANRSDYDAFLLAGMNGPNNTLVIPAGTTGIGTKQSSTINIFVGKGVQTFAPTTMLAYWNPVSSSVSHKYFTAVGSTHQTGYVGECFIGTHGAGGGGTPGTGANPSAALMLLLKHDLPQGVERFSHEDLEELGRSRSVRRRFPKNSRGIHGVERKQINTGLALAEARRS